MTGETEPMHNGGWAIATGFAATAASCESRNFYAVYAGVSFGYPERGIIAVMASAHPAPPGHRAAGTTAQLAAHSLAEGYFGAQRTLSARRAASVALTAINRWLFAQAHGLGYPIPVTLTTVMFHQSRVGLASIGACQIYRDRGGTLVPLLRDHTTGAPDSRQAPVRMLGLEPDVSIDYSEEEAEPADRYILLTGIENINPDEVHARLTKQLSSRLGASDFASAIMALTPSADRDISVMVLDIVQAPAGSTAAHAELADLPLRPAPREGDVWDGFTIGKTLYRGRYTMLKAAYDTIGKREVALKIPLPSMLQDAVFAAGFMRETWIGATLRGSGIARYLELAPDRRSSLYLVMPLYKGETLETRLHRTPPVSLPEGHGIALQLCEAVQDLAAIQIVHRDIKPENIMLLERGEVRLLDLGLAYLPGIDMADSVKPGGTIRYMAPEILQGTPASARTEVYALAVTLYRMYSGGSYPFGQLEVVPLARLRPDLPRWVGQCLSRALAPKPADRYEDAGEFASALQFGLVNTAEELPTVHKAFPPSQLQLWQLATSIFAAGFLFLLLRRFF